MSEPATRRISRLWRDAALPIPQLRVFQPKPPTVGWVTNASRYRECSLFVRQGGSVRACLQVCRHGAEAGKLPRPHTHAGTSTHASHAEDMSVNLFHGLRFLICVYFILLRP